MTRELLPDEKATVVVSKRTADLVCLLAGVGLYSVIGDHIKAITSGHMLMVNLSKYGSDLGLDGMADDLNDLMAQVDPTWNSKEMKDAISC